MKTLGGDPPRISVIVSVREEPESVRDSLASLGQQEGIEEAEVILADGSGGGTELVKREFPWVRHLPLEPASLPALKGAAIQASRGGIIAILDARDIAEPGWLREILGGFIGDAVAIGGAVVPDGPPTAANLAAYLFEYGAFAPPLSPGATDGDLPGNNVAYRREALIEACGDMLAGGFWKPFFHQRMRALGGTLHLRPGMRVRHCTQYRALAFCLRCFHHGRCFGAMRMHRATRGQRAAYRGLCPFVPILLFIRQVRRALRHPANRRLLPRVAGALFGMCLSWGVGESLGYWSGSGRSCEKVY